MPTMNFKKTFVEPILDGTKAHTIRFSKRQIRKGQLLYCQTGSRFAPSRFAVLPAMRVRKILLSRDTVMICDEEGPEFTVPPLHKFARADGFQNWVDLREWFDSVYGTDRGVMEGQLVQWIPAEWEK